MSDGISKEPGGWARLGKRPGPVMYALDFMRIERIHRCIHPGRPWRAWDVVKIPTIRPTHAMTFHKTLKDAKAHCEALVRPA